MSDTGPADCRTTPRRLWWVAFTLMVGLCIYFLGCFHWALDRQRPRWTAMGVWSMFALEQKRHLQLEALAEIDGVWEPVDLPSLFPYRWESGHRWERASFLHSPRRMGVLGASLCLRHPGHPTRVRFEQLRWQKVLGTRAQPRRAVKAELLREWSCSAPHRLPFGRSL